MKDSKRETEEGRGRDSEHEKRGKKRIEKKAQHVEREDGGSSSKRIFKRDSLC